MKMFAITGIGTDVGKTVVSAILVEALKATYWKPVQAGDLSNSDSIKVQSLCPDAEILKEVYRLSEPMSPHAAARIDGVQIGINDFSLPTIDGNFIVEGAGGLMVPLNDDGLTYADVFEQWQLPVVIVSKHYLGSINHSLMTAELLKSRKVEVAGFIFVGAENKETEEIILRTTGLPMIARIPWSNEVNRGFIIEQGSKLAESSSLKDIHE